MNFMEPQITEKTDWLEVESTNFGTSWVEADFVAHWPIPTDVEVLGSFIHPGILSDILRFTEITKPEHVDYITLRRGYGTRLSAPGFLDCTEWTVFKTLKEARDYLKEQEGDE